MGKLPTYIPVPCRSLRAGVLKGEGREAGACGAGSGTWHVSRQWWHKGTQQTPLSSTLKRQQLHPSAVSFISKNGIELRNGPSAGLSTQLRGRETFLPWSSLAPSFHEKENPVGAEASPEVWGSSPLQSGRKWWFHEVSLESSLAWRRQANGMLCMDAGCRQPDPPKMSPRAPSKNPASFPRPPSASFRMMLCGQAGTKG